MRVNTIYPAFMGEVNPYGIGVPCVFVRFAGCNLRCYKETLGILCDTPEALEFNTGDDMTPQQIADFVEQFGIKVVCLTGGEPLCQKEEDLIELLFCLRDSNHAVVVETNGTRSITPYISFDNVSFVVDIKAGSSGEALKMRVDNWFVMRKRDWVKFVIYDTQDIEEMLMWCAMYRGSYKGHISAGLFWGGNVKYGGVDGHGLLNTIIMEHPEYKIHLNMQTHKLIWMYDADPSRAKEIIAPKNL